MPVSVRVHLVATGKRGSGYSVDAGLDSQVTMSEAKEEHDTPEVWEGSEGPECSEGLEGAGAPCQAGPQAGVRLCEVCRPSGGGCGFHLTRTKWDPYPWISAVDSGSAAQQAGLQVGDCLLEVNGDDVLGQRIGEIAGRVRARQDKAALLVWNCGSEQGCDPEALCCGPMPVSLQRLSTCLGSILSALECPVCLDTIPPPALQCANGHLICLGCRARADRCPVCRVRLCRGRSLLADQVFQALTDAFNLRGEPPAEQPAKLRLKLFGSARKKERAAQPQLKVSFTASPTNKLLTRLMGKSSSVDNLSSAEPVLLSAMPRHLSIVPGSEFGSQLKTKSLSSSEIFRPSSPGPGSLGNSRRLDSPAGSVGSVSSVGGTPPGSPRPPRSGLLSVALESSRRPASYHGSCENLRSRLASDFSFPDEDTSPEEDTSSDAQDRDQQPQAPQAQSQGKDSAVYRCPWSARCPLTLAAWGLAAHARAHDALLVLVFQPRVELALPLLGAVCVQLPGPREIFVTSSKAPGGETMIRAWAAGTAAEVSCWRLHVRTASTDVTVHVGSLSVDARDTRQDAEKSVARISEDATRVELEVRAAESSVESKTAASIAQCVHVGVVDKDLWR